VFEAARRRALRGKWARMPSNKGVTLVMPPNDLSDRCAPDGPNTSALVTALESHIKTLQGDNETLKERLALEQARTTQAIAAFSTLADRLDALAAERAKPWWRRIRA
jgi:hypothetical protein